VDEGKAPDRASAQLAGGMWVHAASTGLCSRPPTKETTRSGIPRTLTVSSSRPFWEGDGWARQTPH
jgi:hypothetical protein